MDRFLGRFAALAAVVSLVLGLVLWLRLREKSGVRHPAAMPAGERAEGAGTPESRPAAGGPTYDDVARTCDSKIAGREEKICASVWPRVLRTSRWKNPPSCPKTIDGLLNRLMSRGASDTADAGPEGAAPPQSLVTRCMGNLKYLGMYLSMFEGKYGTAPLTWEELKLRDLAGEDALKFLVCPLDPPGTVSSYEYLWPFRGDATPFNAILAYDKTAHADGKHSVLLFDGRADILSGEDLRERLARQREEEAAALPDAVMKARTEAADTSLTAVQHERALKRLSALQSR